MFHEQVVRTRLIFNLIIEQSFKKLIKLTSWIRLNYFKNQTRHHKKAIENNHHAVLETNEQALEHDRRN